MPEQRYDIYFRGEVNDGFKPDDVKSGFGQLFKASPEKIEQLFSGKVVALKKGLDKPTTLKFKQALENTGAKIYVKLATEETLTTTPKAVSAATNDSPAAANASPVGRKPTTADTKAMAPVDTGVLHLDILPPGSDVLTQSERRVFEKANIDVSKIQLASVFDNQKPAREPPPPAPDVSHITAAAPGADVLEGYRDKTPPPPAPDVGHISLAAAGADVLEGYRNSSPPPPAPDTDYISLAEVGADIDPSEKKPAPPAPDVSHIRLA